jgi:hypothetical protein
MTTAQHADAYRRSIESLGRLRLLRYTFFPPRDLYALVFETPPVLADRRLSSDVACFHRHPGPYEIGVTCGEKIENPVSHVGNVHVVATFSDRSGQPVARIERETRQASRAWWAGPDRNGFGLLLYSVPTDVPRQEQLNCRVEIIDADGALAYYRPSTIYAGCIFQK